MLRFDLWLLYTFLDKDHKMYTCSCFRPYIENIYSFEKVLMIVQHGFWLIWFIVVTYSQFDSNIRVLYVFLGF
jgi:hypothetical protein